MFGTAGGVEAHETWVFFLIFCNLPRLIVSGSPRFNVAVILVSVDLFSAFSFFPRLTLNSLPPPQETCKPPSSVFFFVHLYPDFFGFQYGGEDGPVLHNFLGPF